MHIFEKMDSQLRKLLYIDWNKKENEFSEWFLSRNYPLLKEKSSLEKFEINFL